MKAETFGVSSPSGCGQALEKSVQTLLSKLIKEYLIKEYLIIINDSLFLELGEAQSSALLPHFVSVFIPRFWGSSV